MANNISTYNFSPSTLAKSSEVNQNFTDQAEMKNAKAAGVLSSAQVVGSGSTTLLQLGTELYDPGSNYDNTATNYKFTAPVTGYYDVKLQVGILSLGDQKKIIPWIYVNGAAYLAGQSAASGAQDITANIQSVLSLTAADEVQFYVRHENGSNRTLISTSAPYQTFFSVHLLST